jgi:hypothetical protein
MTNAKEDRKVDEKRVYESEILDPSQVKRYRNLDALHKLELMQEQKQLAADMYDVLEDEDESPVS